MRAILTGLGWRLPLSLLLAISSGEALARRPEPPAAAVTAHAVSLQPPGAQAAAGHPELTPPSASVDPLRLRSPRVTQPFFSPAGGNAFQGRRLADRKGGKDDKDNRKSRGKDHQALERGRGLSEDRLHPADRKKLEERRRRFRELPPQEQRRLLEARERFRHLPPEERARLREKWRQLSPEERRRWYEVEPETEH